MVRGYRNFTMARDIWALPAATLAQNDLYPNSIIVRKKKKKKNSVSFPSLAPALLPPSSPDAATRGDRDGDERKRRAMAALLNPTSTSSSSSASSSSSLSPSLRQRRRGARRPLGVRHGCLDGPSGGWLLHDAGAEALESLATAPDLPEQSAPGILAPNFDPVLEKP